MVPISLGATTALPFWPAVVMASDGPQLSLLLAPAIRGCFNLRLPARREGARRGCGGALPDRNGPADRLPASPRPREPRPPRGRADVRECPTSPPARPAPCSPRR